MTGVVSLLVAVQRNAHRISYGLFEMRIADLLSVAFNFAPHYFFNETTWKLSSRTSMSSSPCLVLVLCFARPSLLLLPLRFLRPQRGSAIFLGCFPFYHLKFHFLLTMIPSMLYLLRRPFALTPTAPVFSLSPTNHFTIIENDADIFIIVGVVANASLQLRPVYRCFCCCFNRSKRLFF